MADSTNWEERLDIDDSDLITIVPSISSHPLRPCSSHSTNPFVQNPGSVSPRFIPGPARAVQAAMNRTKKRDVEETGSRTVAFLEVGGSMDLDEEVDGDFLLDSWIYAMQYLGTEINSVSQIGSIRTRTIDRIPMVVGLVKSCTPNGLGDLVLNLKDQTGTIRASIHHKALLQGTLRSDVTIGCVLILKKVVVFSPARSVRYLNITEDNVVKLIGKNCGAPQEHSISSIVTKLQDNGKERLENRQMERASAIQETSSTRADFCGIISRLNPKATGASKVRTSIIPNCQQIQTVELARDSQDILRKISGDALFSKFSKESTTVKNFKENLKPNQENDGKGKLVSKVSLPEWTDEQLSQLFADY